MRHASIRVTGRVQGVYFRASTKEQADQLGIVGFVRNEMDGGVYIEAEGDEKVIQELILWCHSGPRGASIDNVEIRDGEIKGFGEFRIERSGR